MHAHGEQFLSLDPTTSMHFTGHIDVLSIEENNRSLLALKMQCFSVNRGIFLNLYSHGSEPDVKLYDAVLPILYL